MKRKMRRKRKMSLVLAGVTALLALNPLNAQAGDIIGVTNDCVMGGYGNDSTYYYIYNISKTYNYKDEDGFPNTGFVLKQNVLSSDGNLIATGKDTTGFPNSCRVETSDAEIYDGENINQNIKKRKDFLPIAKNSYKEVEKICPDFKEKLIDFLKSNYWMEPGVSNNLYRELCQGYTNNFSKIYYQISSSDIEGVPGPPDTTTDDDPNPTYRATFEVQNKYDYDYAWKLIKFTPEFDVDSYVAKYSSDSSNIRFDKVVNRKESKVVPKVYFNHLIENQVPYTSEFHDEGRTGTIRPFYFMRNYTGLDAYEDFAGKIDYNSNFEYHLWEYIFSQNIVKIKIWEKKNDVEKCINEMSFDKTNWSELADYIKNTIYKYGDLYSTDGSLLFSYDEGSASRDNAVNNFSSSLSYIFAHDGSESHDTGVILTTNINNSSHYDIKLPDIKLDNWLDLQSENFINQEMIIGGEKFIPKFSVSEIASQVNNRINDGNRIISTDIDTNKILQQDLSNNNLNIKLDSSKRPGSKFENLSDNNAKHIKLNFNGTTFGVDSNQISGDSIESSAVGTQFKIENADYDFQPRLYVGYEQTKSPETMTIKVDSNEETDGAYMINKADSVDIGVKSMKYDDVGRALGFSTCDTNFWFTIPRVGTVNELGFNYDPSVPTFLDASNITHDMVQKYRTNGIPIPTNVAESDFNNKVTGNNVTKTNNKILLTESYIQPVLSGNVYTKDAAGNN